MKPESVFRSKVRQFLKKLDHTVPLTLQQRAISGHPDFVLSVRGRFIALELKARGGVVSAIQRHTLDVLRTKGGAITYVANPDNWEEIKVALLSHDKGDFP